MSRIPLGRRAKRSTLAEQTYDALREQIVDQKLLPGTRLNIDALAREMEVSSSPIREALVRLEAERLIVSELYTGYSVAPHPTAQYLSALLDYRILVEGYCADIGAPGALPADHRRAAPRTEEDVGSAQDRAALSRVQEVRRSRRQVPPDSGRERAQSGDLGHLQFPPHQVVQSRLYLRRSEGGSSSNVVAEHAAILDGFERGDGKAAAEAVKAHLEGGRTRLVPLAEKSRQAWDAVG